MSCSRAMKMMIGDMENSRPAKQWQQPKEPTIDRPDKRKLRLAGHNGKRLRGTTR